MYSLHYRAGTRVFHRERCVTSPAHTAPPIERIGIDESGKGDYFGPLVIAAVFVDATTQHELAFNLLFSISKVWFYL